MSKKPSESFKVYAQGWRREASPVQPPLINKEHVTIFLETSPHTYYDLLIGQVSASVTNLAQTGEMINGGLKTELGLSDPI